MENELGDFFRIIESKKELNYYLSKDRLIEILNDIKELGIIPKDTSIDFNQIEDIYSDEINKYAYSYLYNISSNRYFGESWGQVHLQKFNSNFLKPTKALDINYQPQQYDLYYKGIRVEVKASRATDISLHNGSLLDRAITYEDSAKFRMNFEQIKPNCCDIFIFMCVWLDKLVYYVIPSNEITTIPYYHNKMHRNSINEGQMAIKSSNIALFNSMYRIEENNIINYLNNFSNRLTSN